MMAFPSDAKPDDGSQVAGEFKRFLGDEDCLKLLHEAISVPILTEIRALRADVREKDEAILFLTQTIEALRTKIATLSGLFITSIRLTITGESWYFYFEQCSRLTVGFYSPTSQLMDTIWSAMEILGHSVQKQPTVMVGRIAAS
jgi:hypothetical protein